MHLYYDDMCECEVLIYFLFTVRHEYRICSCLNSHVKCIQFHEFNNKFSIVMCRMVHATNKTGSNSGDWIF
jgi:hypothetical protein